MAISIGSILSTARSAMSANQAAIAVVSHNVANAATEGHSRQRAIMEEGPPQYLPEGVFGTGVRIADVERVRDRLLDIGFRDETSNSGYWDRRGALLGEIEALLGPVGSSPMPAALDRFWNAWADLANDPSSGTARGLVRDAGQGIIDEFKRLTSGLDRASATADARLRGEVSRLNQLSSEIAKENARIVAAEAGGRTAGDLRDARDRAIDAMAQLADIQVIERADGTVAVNIGGVNVVDGGEAKALQVNTAGGTWSLTTASGNTVTVRGGSMGGALGVLNTEIPSIRADLDTLARELVTAVNTVHRTGMNAAGQTDVLFFDDTGNVANVTAATLSLSAAVAGNPVAIAAGTPATDPVSGLPVYGAGRNDVALALSGLRTAPIAAYGGRSLGEGHAARVADLGALVRSAEEAAEVHTSLANEADIRRMSVSGVSIDEEMVSLIKFQNAYSAAARVVTTVDEMLQTLLDMKR